MGQLYFRQSGPVILAYAYNPVFTAYLAMGSVKANCIYSSLIFNRVFYGITADSFTELRDNLVLTINKEGLAVHGRLIPWLRIKRVQRSISMNEDGGFILLKVRYDASDMARPSLAFVLKLVYWRWGNIAREYIGGFSRGHQDIMAVLCKYYLMHLFEDPMLFDENGQLVRLPENVKREDVAAKLCTIFGVIPWSMKFFH